MFTRNSVIFPRSIFTFCSWIQALLMFFRVISARAIPTRRASSKLFVDEAVISVTFATAIAFSLLFACVSGSKHKGRRETAFVLKATGALSQVDMIFLPALRLATRPFPPGFFAARFLAAVIRPPLLFFAISITSFCSSCRMADLIPQYSPLTIRVKAAEEYGGRFDPRRIQSGQVGRR